MTPTMKKDHGDKARDAANQAVDKAKEAVSQTGEAISQAASTAAHAVGQKAEDATAAVGSGIQTLADKVRDQGPHQGTLGSATRTVADGLDQAGHYIEDKNLSGMMDDVTGLIKRNPLPAVLIGIGIGFLIGRTLRS
jgi:ABC-type transporter Mla subunit MlaD